MDITFSARIMKCLALTAALCIAFIFAAHAGDLSIKTTIPGIPQIDTGPHILINYSSGKVFAKQNAGIRCDPASLTKMMTSYVIGQVMRTGEFKETDLVTVGDGTWATGNPVFRGSPLMFLRPGMWVPVLQLIRGISLQSGDDAYVAMTDLTASSQNALAGLVNNYVDVLGLRNTHFQTVHGLDADDQYSSARDMAPISQALTHDIPNGYSTYKEKESTPNGIRQLNRNGLLRDNSLNVDGVETGHTSKTGYSLVASVTRGRMRLTFTVMSGRTFKDREAEGEKLLAQDFHFFGAVSLLEVGRELASEPVWFGDSGHASLGVDKNVYLAIPCGRMEDPKAGYVLNSSRLHMPLQENQVVRAIDFRPDGKTTGQRPLVML